MYGTIFNLEVKPGHEEALLTSLKDDNVRKPEGMIAWFVMNPDENEDWIGVAVFESKDAHMSNANSLEQHESFLKLMEHLESEPIWVDGTYVIGEIA